MTALKGIVLGFVAGAIATLTVHELISWLFNTYWTGWERVSWDMAPLSNSFLPDVTVPKIVSAAFWGGLWGIVLWALIRKRTGVSHWLLALVLGAVLPSLVAWFVVFPIKDIALTGTLIGGALLLNGAWGIGVALCMRLFGQRD